IRSQMGLDRPLPVQYLEWLRGVARGDLGRSLALSIPVTQLILERLPRTLEVAGLSILLGLLVGLPIGLVAALRRGRAEDVGLTATSLLTLSIPAYVSGTVLVLIFAVWLRWLPASGFVNFSENPRRHIMLLILPCVTLASQLSASIMRLTRSSVLEVINQDHVRTARSKGLTDGQVIRRHVLRNSLIPVSTIVGIQAGNLLGGAVIVETIFSWPGIGKLVVDAIFDRDYPMIQGFVIFMGTAFLIINLIVDLGYGLIDPRIRLANR
ncbi:MAG: ABC transporter permease, partial [Thermomicrobiales bacterium]